MKKIGLATVYSKINYGTVLQAYATQILLEKMGYRNETIDLRGVEKELKTKKLSYFVKHIFQKNLIKTKIGLIVKRFLVKMNYNNLRKKEQLRKQEFNIFIDEYFNFSPAFQSIQELQNYAKGYDAVVVGSDQIWLPQHIEAGYYTLEWVPEGVKKISLSSSFGITDIPMDLYSKAISYLSKMDYISVREKTGAELIKKLIKKDVEVLCDPTMALTINDWEKLAQQDRKCEMPYILCYFLGKNRKHRHFASELRKLTGYKIISLAHMDEYTSIDECIADEILYDVGPERFLNLIKNAEYICTDSYHASVFSVIFHKQFFVFNRFDEKSKMSTNSRISTLLEHLGLENRQSVSIRDIKLYIEHPTDYNDVEKKMIELRKQVFSFLDTALWDRKECNRVDEFDKFDCCGCAACSEVCPTNCITMNRDEEGFLYPIVDKKLCVECRNCVENCPIYNKQRNTKSEQKAYLAQNINDEIRAQSTSGGAFSAIAEVIIMSGGVVYGAVCDERAHVKHIGISAIGDVCKFRGSKYVQSEIKNCYKEILEYLKVGKVVCFSGTPCQIEAIRQYLGREYENLILVDVVCRGTPSPIIWEKYAKQKTANKELKQVAFRSKDLYGYRYSQMKIESNKGAKYFGGIDNNGYLRSFFSNTNVRPSCFKCKFRSRYRNADITLWDCLDVERYAVGLDDKGTTHVLVHSEKGQSILGKCTEKVKLVQIDVDKAVADVNEMRRSKLINKSRIHFFEKQFDEENIDSVFEAFYPITIRVKLEHIVRVVSVKMGIYGVIKKIFHKIHS